MGQTRRIAAAARSLARIRVSTRGPRLALAGGVHINVLGPGLLAITLASCAIETSYVPRTPHRLALGMKNGELAVYKDGGLITVSSAPDVVVGCSPAATSDAREAASQWGSYSTDIKIAGVCNALSVFAPPLVSVGIYFTVLASNHQQQAGVHIVDAINSHNDEIACVPQ